MKIVKAFTIATIFLLFPLQIFAQEPDQNCNVSDENIERILEQVEKKNPNAIKALPACFKLNRKLILKAVLIDPLQFENAHELLKEDDLFVRRLLKAADPNILRYASPKLRSDKIFMEHATYLNRDSLQYADPMVLDNKLFMKKMISIDSRNYIFASERLRELPEFAEMAFYDNGMLLSYAPQKIKADKKLVKIAVQSNVSALDFAADELKKDKDLQAIIKKNTSIKFSKEEEEKLQDFIRKNYLTEEEGKNLGFVISNQGKKFGSSKKIDRNYVTKWQKNLNFETPQLSEDLRLITVDSRNYPILWKEDFRRYPDLIKKIENFFRNKNIDQNTIDNLSLTYLWKIKSKPLTFALNLYLLRDSKDIDLGPEFSDITSLTAIIQKQGTKWRTSVVEVIFDSEWKVDTSYANGHKKYILWDLYRINKHDKNPKIIFKVEDKFREYFEVFEEQSGGKYQMIYYFDPLGEMNKSESLN